MQRDRDLRFDIQQTATAARAFVYFVSTALAGCGLGRTEVTLLPRSHAMPSGAAAEIDQSDDPETCARCGPSMQPDGGVSTSHSSDPSEAPHPELVEVRPSNIPTAGEGLFAKADIAVDTYIGFYKGPYLTGDEIDVLPEYESAYLFEIPDCADTTYDSIAGDPSDYVSKANYAPAEINGRETQLQNVDFHVRCQEPYVRLYSFRDIEAGEELYVDYGPDYDYVFMHHPAVQQFFLETVGEEYNTTFVFEYSHPGLLD